MRVIAGQGMARPPSPVVCLDPATAHAAPVTPSAATIVCVSLKGTTSGTLSCRPLLGSWGTMEGKLSG